LIDFGLLILERKLLKNFLGESYPLLLTTLESSFSKDDLCQVWLKLAQWFWRKIF
jgi:hypothetical protein